MFSLIIHVLVKYSRHMVPGDNGRLTIVVFPFSINFLEQKGRCGYL